MPKLRQYADKYATEDFLREIRTKQGKYNLMTLRSLSDASEIAYDILRRRMMNPENFTIAEIKKLISTLDLDLGIVNAFLGFKKKDIFDYSKKNCSSFEK